MSKFLHPRGEPRASGECDIPWPALPWTCPCCGIVYPTHESTVATVDLDPPDPITAEAWANAQFLCVQCDLETFMRESN